MSFGNRCQTSNIKIINTLLGGIYTLKSHDQPSLPKDLCFDWPLRVSPKVLLHEYVFGAQLRWRSWAVVMLRPRPKSRSLGRRSAASDVCGPCDRVRASIREPSSSSSPASVLASNPNTPLDQTPRKLHDRATPRQETLRYKAELMPLSASRMSEEAAPFATLAGSAGREWIERSGYCREIRR